VQTSGVHLFELATDFFFFLVVNGSVRSIGSKFSHFISKKYVIEPPFHELPQVVRVLFAMVCKALFHARVWPCNTMYECKASNFCLILMTYLMFDSVPSSFLKGSFRVSFLLSKTFRSSSLLSRFHQHVCDLPNTWTVTRLCCGAENKLLVFNAWGCKYKALLQFWTAESCGSRL
jgi:hypothetical protein